MSTTKLVLKMGTASGVKTWSFNYANPSVTAQQIKSFMNTMIANGSIYRYPPLTRDSAQLLTTSETNIDVSD